MVWYFVALNSIDTVKVIMSDWRDTGADAFQRKELLTQLRTHPCEIYLVDMG